MLCLGGTAAQGAEGVTLNGFLTAGTTYIDSEVSTQEGTITDRVGFENDSRLGIQLSAEVNPKVDVTSQLLVGAKSQNFNMRADWAFVTYHAANPLDIRAGKVKLTTFLISDYIEVGYAYPWIRPPREVYSANPISSINGVDSLVKLYFGNQLLLIQPYFGTSRGEQALAPQEGRPFTLADGTVVNPGEVYYADFTADHMVGINVSFGGDAFTVRGGYLETLVSAPNFGVVDDLAKFGSVGATLDWKNIVAYAEYYEREIEPGANAAFPNQKGYYTTLGYRIGKFLPHLTYAKLTDNENPDPSEYPMGAIGAPLEQHSVTAGLRYELGVGAALKFEVQQVTPKEGTRGLLIADPNGSGLEDPKKSVYIYGLAVDVVF